MKAYIFRAISRPVIDAIEAYRGTRGGTFDPETPAYANLGKLKIVVGRNVIVPCGNDAYAHTDESERVDFLVAAVGSADRLIVQRQICELFRTKADGVEFIGHYSDGKLLTDKGLD